MKIYELCKKNIHRRSCKAFYQVYGILDGCFALEIRIVLEWYF